MTPAAPRKASPAMRLLRSRILRPMNDPVAWDRLLRLANPLWSLGDIRARVVRREEEGAGTFSLWLAPNRHWRGHRPGQHLSLAVVIDGVLRHRTFSISSAGDRRSPLRLTIRRQPGQGVTDWLHRHAGVGDVVTLSQAGGGFTLPEPRPAGMLMLAAGSGITPLLAMLHALAAESHVGDIVLLQLCRDASDRLFADELAALAGKLPGLRLETHYSAISGRMTPAELERRVPDLARRISLLCGPPGLTEAVVARYAARGLSGQLLRESFGRVRVAEAAAASSVASHRVDCLDSAQAFTQSGAVSLLEAAEQAGLTPRSGCRAGLCRTCLCRKRSGVVRNLLTGQRSAEPDEWVQLCISVPESDLELAL